MKDNVTGSIFTYESLKEKAEREIVRLDAAERAFDNSAMDHAINAAFSVYHLLEWQYKTAYPNSQCPTASQLVNGAECAALNILHDIVTFTKHAEVGGPKHAGKIVVYDSPKKHYLQLEDGSHLLQEDGSELLLEGSRLVIKFDAHKALSVLRDALSCFE